MAEKNGMPKCKYMTVLALLLAGSPVLAATAAHINLAEFGRVVEMAQDPPQPTTAADELVRGSEGWDAVRGPDGQYVIGVEWDEPRDIVEVNIEFRHAIAGREQIKVQYWKSDRTTDGQGESGKMPPGRWLTPKVDWWAGDRDVSFAFLPDDREALDRNEADRPVRRTTRIRFLCGKEDLPPVRYLRAYGPEPSVMDTFDVRIGEPGLETPVAVEMVNGFVLAGDGKTRLTSTVLRERAATLRIVYARSASIDSPNSTRVTLESPQKASPQIAFHPAEVARQGRQKLVEASITVERRGGGAAAAASASQPAAQ